MEQILLYAPVVLILIIFLLQYNIFMTPADFENRRAKFLEYIAEHYVSKDSCSNNNSFVTNEISTIKTDLKEDIKELKEDMNKKMDGVQNNVEKLTNIIMKRIEQMERNK